MQMEKGIVFDIQELCVHDGPGPRTTVFLKGCPMRCRWCHNPEGLRLRPQLFRGAGCRHCGACEGAEALLLKGDPDAALALCPWNVLRVAGREYDATALALDLLRYRDSFLQMGGGVTVSGGECLLQSAFVAELFMHLSGVHRAIETAGDVPREAFMQVLPHCDLVMIDVKLMDADAHVRWTGVPNGRILENLRFLMQSSVPLVVRIPLIPGVNDDAENLRATAEYIAGAPNLLRVEILPYNVNAGAKYAAVGAIFDPGLDEKRKPLLENASVFSEYNIRYEVL